MTEYDLDRLDDVVGLTEADPQDMLRAVATSAAQVRASYQATREASLGALAFDSRPRAIVVAGMGGSAISGDVLAAVAGHALPGAGVRPSWLRAAGLGRCRRSW